MRAGKSNKAWWSKSWRAMWGKGNDASDGPDQESASDEAQTHGQDPNSSSPADESGEPVKDASQSADEAQRHGQDPDSSSPADESGEPVTDASQSVDGHNDPDSSTSPDHLGFEQTAGSRTNRMLVLSNMIAHVGRYEIADLLGQWVSNWDYDVYAKISGTGISKKNAHSFSEGVTLSQNAERQILSAFCSTVAKKNASIWVGLTLSPDHEQQLIPVFTAGSWVLLVLFRAQRKVICLNPLPTRELPDHEFREELSDYHFGPPPSGVCMSSTVSLDETSVIVAYFMLACMCGLPLDVLSAPKHIITFRRYVVKSIIKGHIVLISGSAGKVNNWSLLEGKRDESLDNYMARVSAAIAPRQKDKPKWITARNEWQVSDLWEPPGIMKEMREFIKSLRVNMDVGDALFKDFYVLPTVHLRELFQSGSIYINYDVFVYIRMCIQIRLGCRLKTWDKSNSDIRKLEKRTVTLNCEGCRLLFVTVSRASENAFKVDAYLKHHIDCDRAQVREKGFRRVLFSNQAFRCVVQHSVRTRLIQCGAPQNFCSVAFVRALPFPLNTVVTADFVRQQVHHVGVHPLKNLVVALKLLREVAFVLKNVFTEIIHFATSYRVLGLFFLPTIHILHAICSSNCFRFIVQLDSAHTFPNFPPRTFFKKVLSLVVRMPEGSILPIGVFWITAENMDCVRVVLVKLKEILESLNMAVNFMSDQAPAFKAAIKEVFPQSAHLFCSYHIAGKVSCSDKYLVFKLARCCHLETGVAIIQKMSLNSRKSAATLISSMVYRAMSHLKLPIVERLRLMDLDAGRSDAERTIAWEERLRALIPDSLDDFFRTLRWELKEDIPLPSQIARHAMTNAHGYPRLGVLTTNAVESSHKVYTRSFDFPRAIQMWMLDCKRAVNTFDSSLGWMLAQSAHQKITTFASVKASNCLIGKAMKLRCITITGECFSFFERSVRELIPEGFGGLDEYDPEGIQYAMDEDGHDETLIQNSQCKIEVHDQFYGVQYFITGDFTLGFDLSKRIPNRRVVWVDERLECSCSSHADSGFTCSHLLCAKMKIQSWLTSSGCLCFGSLDLSKMEHLQWESSEHCWNYLPSVDLHLDNMVKAVSSLRFQSPPHPAFEPLKQNTELLSWLKNGQLADDWKQEVHICPEDQKTLDSLLGIDDDAESPPKRHLQQADISGVTCTISGLVNRDTFGLFDVMPVLWEEKRDPAYESVRSPSKRRRMGRC